MTKEYELALNAVREATIAFTATTKAYRAGKADKVYELAYAKEERRA